MVDSHELSKLIKTSQNHDLKLDDVMENQERLELLLNDQKIMLSEVISRLGRLEGSQEKIYQEADVKGKGKGKAKIRKGKFYQVNICIIVILFQFSYL